MSVKKHGSLFSGIGGFDLAAEWMGWENKFHCEWNEFGQKVLNHYWPKSKSYGNIKETDFTEWRGLIDVVSGGFPCQPYSLAGKRKGKEDDRHLWPEMLRAIREIQPRWVVGENVFGLVNWSGGLVFHEVQTDLEAAGYEVWPYVLPACAKNAPHRRDMVWFVAHNKSIRINRTQKLENRKRQSREWWGCNTNDTSQIHGENRNTNATNTDNYGQQRSDSKNEINTSERGEYAQCNTSEGFSNGLATNTGNKGLQGGEIIGNIGESREDGNEQFTRLFQPDWKKFPTQPPICSRDDGLSSRLDGITFPKWRNESIKAAGNAIVPQVVFEIFKAIEEYDRRKTKI